MERTDKTVTELIQQAGLNRPEYGYELMSYDGHIVRVIGTKEKMVFVEDKTEE